MTANDRQRYDHFYGLIARHKSLIEGLCMRRARGDIGRCKELIQECYIVIWKHEKEIAPNISPKQETLWVYWLCRQAIHNASLLRSSHIVIPIDEMLSDTLADGDESAALREYVESLAEILDSREQHVVKLMIKGYTPKDMVAELGIKRRSVIQLCYRIVRKLRHYYHPDNQQE